MHKRFGIGIAALALVAVAEMVRRDTFPRRPSRAPAQREAPVRSDPALSVQRDLAQLPQRRRIRNGHGRRRRERPLEPSKTDPRTRPPGNGPAAVMLGDGRRNERKGQILLSVRVVPGDTVRKTMTSGPMRTSSPSDSAARRSILLPLRCVPFLLSRSSSIALPPATTIRAWRRETDGWSIQEGRVGVAPDDVFALQKLYLAAVEREAIARLPRLPPASSATRTGRSAATLTGTSHR